MKLASSFTVPAPPERVFELFLDPPTMMACVPGLEELQQIDETHYKGRVVNEIAHVRFNAPFSAEALHLNPPHEARGVVKGEDRRLASSVKADASLTVEPQGDDASVVSYEVEVAIWGKIGRMGESIFRRRTAEVEAQFVEAFSRVCRGEPADGRAPAGPVAVGAGQTTSTDGQVSTMTAPQDTSVIRDRMPKQLASVVQGWRPVAAFGAPMAAIVFFVIRRMRRRSR